MNFFKKIAIMLCAFVVSTPTVYAIGSGSTGDTLNGRGHTLTLQQQHINAAKEYEKGLAYLQNEKFSKAEKSFKKLLALTHHDAHIHYLMGLAKAGQNKNKAAVRYLKKAIKYDKKLYEAYGSLAQSYVKLKRPEKAGKILQTLKVYAADCHTNCKDASRLSQIVQFVKDIVETG